MNHDTGATVLPGSVARRRRSPALPVRAGLAVCVLAASGCASSSTDVVATECGRIHVGESAASAGVGVGPLCGAASEVQYCAGTPFLSATGDYARYAGCGAQVCLPDGGSAEDPGSIADGGVDCSDVTFGLVQNDDPSSDLCCVTCCVVLSHGSVVGTQLVQD